MNLQAGARDLVRIVLGVLLIMLLIGGALLILGPFLPALIWATMIVVATWPLMLRLQRALGGRRSLAAAVMTALLLLIVVAPLAVAVSTIATTSEVDDRSETSPAGKVGRAHARPAGVGVSRPSATSPSAAS